MSGFSHSIPASSLQNFLCSDESGRQRRVKKNSLLIEISRPSPQASAFVTLSCRMRGTLRRPGERLAATRTHLEHAAPKFSTREGELGRIEELLDRLEVRARELQSARLHEFDEGELLGRASSNRTSSSQLSRRNASRIGSSALATSTTST